MTPREKRSDVNVTGVAVWGLVWSGWGTGTGRGRQGHASEDEDDDEDDEAPAGVTGSYNVAVPVPERHARIRDEPASLNRATVVRSYPAYLAVDAEIDASLINKNDIHEIRT